MPKVVSSFESIRQTLDYGQFDVCESLLRDLIGNSEVDRESRELLKELLSSVIARRALDHSRNFVASNNLESARRILHKAWHRLETEGLEAFAERGRAAIARAASDSELSGFDADHLSEIINAYVGAKHFSELVGLLPQAEHSTAEIPNDRATRMVKAKEAALVSGKKTSVVVVDPADGSIGQLIMRSMLRPRVILAALLTLVAVMAIGMTTRTTSWQTSFSLLRPTNTGDEAYEVKVPALPKQTLQRLPTQPEVLDAASTAMAVLAKDEATQHVLRPAGLKELVSASVASSDYGQGSLTLDVSFTAPTEEIARDGGKILLEEIIAVHNKIVNSGLGDAKVQKVALIAALEAKISGLHDKLREASKDLTVPAGDQKQRVDTLLKMYAEARKGFYEASAAAAGANVRSTVISGELSGIDETVSWKTSTPVGINNYVLQPLLLQLAADKQRQERLERQIQIGGFGPGHNVSIELENLLSSIAAQEKFIAAQEGTLKAVDNESITERANTTYNAVDVEARLAKADREARVKAKEEWSKAVKSIEAELMALSSTNSPIPDLIKEIDERSQRLTETRTKLWDLEAFAARNPGGLSVISQASAPELSKSSTISIVLAAIGLALLVSIIISFTGGHRALHVVVLGLVATLFYVR